MAIDTGNTAWVLASSCLVFLLTPAIAMFYGGLSGNKNVMNMMFMAMISLGMVVFQFVLFGYSFAFNIGSSTWGNWYWGGLNGFTPLDVSVYSSSVPQIAHVVFHAGVAAWAVSIVSASLYGRMRFGAWCCFTVMWTTIVYDALAHWTWSPLGWLKVVKSPTEGAMDFAGSSIIYMSAGFSSLGASAYLGVRKEQIKNTPICLPFVVIGAGLMMIGWTALNAGINMAADGTAALALMNTIASACASMVTYICWENNDDKKLTIKGAVSGLIAGLVSISGCAGWVHPGWALIIGMIGATTAYQCADVAHAFSIDDPMDSFPLFGATGVVATFLTGLFPNTNVNPAGFNAGFYSHGYVLWSQIALILATIAYSFFGSWFIMYGLHVTTGVRISEESEVKGLDKAEHGETWDIHQEIEIPPVVEEPEKKKKKKKKVVDGEAAAAAPAVAIELTKV